MTPLDQKSSELYLNFEWPHALPNCLVRSHCEISDVQFPYLSSRKVILKVCFAGVQKP